MLKKQKHVRTRMHESRSPASSRTMLTGALAIFLSLVLIIAPLGPNPSRVALTGTQTAEAASLSSSRFFPQTGFFVRNQDGMNLLSEFDRLGGISMLGYPVSRVFEAKGFSHQAFQRAILQWRTETGSAVLANVMDELYSSGRDDWLLLQGVPPHFPGDDGSGGDSNAARVIRMSWLTEPKIAQAYLKHPNPMGFYGLPTSKPERHGPFITQRFQRGVLQLWVDDVAGMPRPGEVVGVLAGDFAKQMSFFDPEAGKPEYTDAASGTGDILLPVPLFKQERNLSCESSAAAMAASYFGVPLPERQIVAELPLDANPHTGFRGNIDAWFGGLDEYGVYAEPIAKILTKHGLKAEVVYGLSHDALRQAISHNKPVIAWITYQVAVRTPVVRDIGGAKVFLVPWEHAVVVNGYDTQGVYVNDPATGGTAYYSNEDFARANGYFDGMAIIVSMQ